MPEVTYPTLYRISQTCCRVGKAVAACAGNGDKKDHCIDQLFHKQSANSRLLSLAKHTEIYWPFIEY
jgi:hypothetical protein